MSGYPNGLTAMDVSWLLATFANGPTTSDVVARMVAAGLLNAHTDALTPRGRAYCLALMSVPLPVERWVVEWPTDPPKDAA